MSQRKSNVDVVRAWKDASYRNSLSDAQRAALPANPAGMVDVDALELGTIDGGLGKYFSGNTGTCGNSCGTCGTCGCGNGIFELVGRPASARLSAISALKAPRV